MLELFVRFLVIGTLAFGGGQAALPLVERLAVADTGWLTPAQFATGIGLSFATPGPRSTTLISTVSASRRRVRGRALTGTWSETSRNVSGRVSGRVNSGQVQARIEGPGFSAGMTINTRGNRQSVTISSPGHEITQVSIDLTKSR